MSPEIPWTDLSSAVRRGIGECDFPLGSLLESETIHHTYTVHIYIYIDIYIYIYTYTHVHIHTLRIASSAFLDVVASGHSGGRNGLVGRSASGPSQGLVPTVLYSIVWYGMVWYGMV